MRNFIVSVLLLIACFVEQDAGAAVITPKRLHAQEKQNNKIVQKQTKQVQKKTLSSVVPLNPVPVKKAIKIVRRPVMVSVIGQYFQSLSAGETPNENRMIQHLLDGMDKEIGKQPDLIVLPENCDMWEGMYEKEARHRWIAQRGDKVLTALRAYAKKHHCYIVYPTYCELGNRHYHNSSFLIDRTGDVIARYDKVNPTIWEIEFGVIPGTKPLVVETDFGRLGFAICFDLNFWNLLERYAALHPDVIVFSSNYHGDFMQQVWAYKCRAHLIASTVGRLPKDIVTPCGSYQHVEQAYFPTFSDTINTNCKVVHIDYNWKKMDAAQKKYGRRIRIDTAGNVGAVTLYSETPDLPVEEIIKEFGIETWDDYYARSQSARCKILENRN